MILTDFLPPKRDRSWDYALQAGVTHAIARCHPRDTGLNPPWDIDALRTVQRNFATAGLNLIGLEGDEFDMRRIKLGLDGRDEDLELYQRMLANMGELGIGLLCYNFMATIGWCRTHTHVPTRGGALTNRFQLSALDPNPVPPEDRVTEEKLWDNYTYFVRAVLPAAEKAGVNMGLHPDDPPLSPLRGVERIFTKPESFARAMSLSDSPSHRITFCQANFKLMGEDIYALAKEWCGKKKIFFVHFRDVDGTPVKFHETFHDNGPTDMVRMLEVYSKAGFVGPIRPDHAPALAGEAQTGRASGYTMGGKVFAFGYMKGIMDALKLPYA